MQEEQRLALESNLEAMAILGRHDEYLTLIEPCFDVNVRIRGEELCISGEAEKVAALKLLFEELLYLYRQGNPITSHEVKYGLHLLKNGQGGLLHKLFADTVLLTGRGRQIKPKTIGQREYLDAIRCNAITFGIGPAGTGKTYLAVAMAVEALRSKVVERIILTRPAVEAGEKLGFLPGDLQEKVDPYLRPLYDALHDILGADTFAKYMAKEIIEVAPLAYMRGRTLESAFIILDEAQNTTVPQMKMFLTRLGFGSKMVVTGDVTQIDLPNVAQSGLAHASRLLKGVEGITSVTLSEADVIRHEVVSRIIKAYAAQEEKEA